MQIHSLFDGITVQRCILRFVFVSLFFRLIAPGIGCTAETFELLPFQRQLSFTGLTRPQKELVISSEVSGRCEKVHLEQGDVVAPAGLVAEMDSTFVELDLQKNRIAQERARSQLELEKKTLSRYTTLVEKNSAALATYDDAQLRAEINLLALKNLKNEELRLQEQFRRHRLYGPPGWKVMERYVESGEFVQQGQHVLRLGNFDQLLVSFSLTFEELMLLQNKEKVMLFVPSLGMDVRGSIYRVSPGFNEKTRKIPVDILMDCKEGSLLRGGVHTELKLDGKKEEGSFLVPFSALISRYDTHWLMTREGGLKNVILLGKSSNGQYAVVAVDGLEAGASFLLTPVSGK